MKGPNDFLTVLSDDDRETVRRIVGRIEAEFYDGITIKVELDIHGRELDIHGRELPRVRFVAWKEVIRQAREAGWHVSRAEKILVIKYPDE